LRHQTQEAMFSNQIITASGKQNANFQEIILLQADVNYTHVYLSNGHKITVAIPLKELEKRFAVCTDFFRTHKSFLINLNYIKNYDDKGSEVFVQMKNGFQIDVSRRKKTAFKRRIFDLTHSLSINYNQKQHKYI
jgi:DNA-binding LytR/AlgR family response regulator